VTSLSYTHLCYLWTMMMKLALLMMLLLLGTNDDAQCVTPAQCVDVRRWTSARVCVCVDNAPIYRRNQVRSTVYALSMHRSILHERRVMKKQREKKKKKNLLSHNTKHYFKNTTTITCSVWQAARTGKCLTSWPPKTKKN